MSLAVRKFNIAKIILNKSIFDDNIIHNILKHYWKILDNKRKIFLDWIDTTLLYDNDNYFYKDNFKSWYNISKNPNAISYIEENMTAGKVRWDGLAKNHNAMDLLEKNTIELAFADCWECLFSNIYGIDFFFENVHKIIHWNYDSTLKQEDYLKIIDEIIEDGILELCKNPNAIDYLENNMNKINWSCLSENPNAIELLTNNQHKIDWSRLSKNPNAIELLKTNQHWIDWSMLSENPNAIELLTNNQDKIDWSMLSKNPNAIKLLESNQHKIDWVNIYKNPSIFQYKQMPSIY